MGGGEDVVWGRTSLSLCPSHCSFPFSTASSLPSSGWSWTGSLSVLSLHPSPLYRVWIPRLLRYYFYFIPQFRAKDSKKIKSHSLGFELGPLTWDPSCTQHNQIGHTIIWNPLGRKFMLNFGADHIWKIDKMWPLNYSLQDETILYRWQIWMPNSNLSCLSIHKIDQWTYRLWTIFNIF